MRNPWKFPWLRLYCAVGGAEGSRVLRLHGSVPRNELGVEVIPCLTKLWWRLSQLSELSVGFILGGLVLLYETTPLFPRIVCLMICHSHGRTDVQTKAALAQNEVDFRSIRVQIAVLSRDCVLLGGPSEHPDPRPKGRAHFPSGSLCLWRASALKSSYSPCPLVF